MKKSRYDRQRNWTINVNNFQVFPERFSRFAHSHSADMSQFNVFWAVFFLFFRPSCLSPTGAWIIKRKYCRPPLAHTFISRLSSVEPNTSLRIRVCLQRNVVLNMQRNRVSHRDRFRSSRYTRTVSTIYTHLSAKSIRDDGRQSHRREGRTSVERFLIFIRPEIRAERGIEWTFPDIL